MLIRVEERHIRNGIRLRETECPIALALKDILPTEYLPIVESTYIQIMMDGEIVRTLSLLDCVSDFISDFDYNWNVEPMEFDLAIEQYLSGEY